MTRKLVLIFLLLLIIIPSEGKNKHLEDTTWNEWHFRISPYFWYLGINGEIIRTFQMMLGYRIWGVKHEFDEAIFNGHAKGWYTRFGFQF